MTQQFSTVLRTAWANQYESEIGTSPKLRIYTGDPPADCSEPPSGTLLGTGTLPSNWMAAASNGSVAKTGTWEVAISTTGTAGHYRLWDSTITTCHEQGTISQALALTTSANTDAWANTLTFTSTTGVVVGQSVTSSYIPAGTTVVALTSTIVTLSQAVSSMFSSGETIIFGSADGDMRLNNTSLSSGQTLTIDIKVLTMPGA